MRDKYQPSFFKTLITSLTLAITESNFDMEKEFQNAKQEAWEEYKIQYLSNILSFV